MSKHLPALIELIGSIPAPVWTTGSTAAALYGFDGHYLRPPFELAVEHPRRIERSGHVVHRIRDIGLIDRCSAQGIPTLSAIRVLLQLAVTEPIGRLTVTLDSAIRDGWASEDFLHRRLHELRRRGRDGVRPLLLALDGNDVARGGHSWLEREFLRLVADAGLPRPATQQVLARRRNAVVRVDCHFPGTNLVVELLGNRFHRTTQQQAVDAERMNALQLRGHLVLQFTYEHVVGDAGWVAASVREALETCRAA